MKKIIDGALFNTETAIEIGSNTSGHSRSDFNFYEETLYRTKSGKYFLHGKGGPNSRYGRWIGNSGSGSEEIRPYTPVEAKAWAEDNLEVDVYSAEFGEPEEASEERKAISITLPLDVIDLLQKKKRETSTPISWLIEMACREIYG